jgi:hypothetical protein
MEGGKSEGEGGVGGGGSGGRGMMTKTLGFSVEEGKHRGRHSWN